MTSEQLDAKYSQLTGLRFKVSDLVEEAGEDSQKLKAAYDHVMWHIKNGLIRGVDGIKELVEEVIPALTEAFGQQSSAQPSEQEVYTAAEAAAYNAQLEGAKTTNDWKIEPVAAVAEVEGVHWTQEEIDAATAAYTNDEVAEMSEEAQATWLEEHPAYGKTVEDWKVEPVAAVAEVEGVKYTQEEADAYNAQLPGAVKAGDAKPNA